VDAQLTQWRELQEKAIPAFNAHIKATGVGPLEVRAN
jgi:hypothetical protein